MNFIKKILKNKFIRKLIYVILFFAGIFLFPSLNLLLIIFLVIALMLDSGSEDSIKKDLPLEARNKKNNTSKGKVNNPELKKFLDDLETKDISEMGSITEQTERILETLQTPKTFFEIIGNLSTNADLYYNLRLYDVNKAKEEENAFIIKDFERVQKCCDEFFDGKEFMKCWTIHRALARKGVSEEEFNKTFPKLVPLVKKIRDRYWEDIAWNWLVADKAEDEYGKNTCTKEIYLSVEQDYSVKDKETFLETLSEENKKDYQLLTKLNLKDEKKKDTDITEKFFNSFDVSKFSGKPSPINSAIKWKLEDAIKFGKLIQRYSSNFSKLSAFGEIDELRKKQCQYAGLVRSEDFYKATFGEKFLEQIKDIHRVSDFYQYEMFDENPIQSAINNEDIERIIFYSLIQLPKITISEIEKLSTDDPIKRAPYFMIMFEHMTIILNVLEDLEIFDNDEIVIRSWILNQITDPLDKGKSLISFGKDNKKGRPYDNRYIEELWIPLYRFIDLQLSHPRGLVDDIEKVIEVVGSLSVTFLYNYFVGDPEEAYSAMKPMLDLLKEAEQDPESEE